MFKLIVWAIVLYLLIRFILRIVIPVWRVSRELQSQMKAFRDQMDPGGSPRGFARNGQSAPETPSRPRTSSSSANQAGEYIDFEEIRD